MDCLCDDFGWIQAGRWRQEDQEHLKSSDSNGIYVRVGQACHPDRAGPSESTLNSVKMKNRVRQCTYLEQATEGSPLHLVQALTLMDSRSFGRLWLGQDDTSALYIDSVRVRRFEILRT